MDGRAGRLRRDDEGGGIATGDPVDLGRPRHAVGGGVEVPRTELRELLGEFPHGPVGPELPHEHRDLRRPSEQADDQVVDADAHEPVRAGSEELIGAVAEVREPLDPDGQVFISGALWRAHTSGGGEIGLGNRVRIKSVDGLTLDVEPVADPDPASVEKGA